jgi:large subunit ribosomal protein L24
MAAQGQDQDQEGRHGAAHHRRSQKNGGDRGKTGKVIAVYPRPAGAGRGHQPDQAAHQGRPARPGARETGGIITQEAAVHVSNVMLVDPETKKPTRVGVRAETVDRGRPAEDVADPGRQAIG